MMRMRMRMMIMMPTICVDCVKLRSATLQEALLRLETILDRSELCSVYFHTARGARTKTTSFLIAGHFT